MPTPNVIFAAQAAAAQPLRHHVWTSHHADGPRLEPAPLPPPLAQAPRQPTVFRDDFEGDGEEGGEDDDSGKEWASSIKRLFPISTS